MNRLQLTALEVLMIYYAGMLQSYALQQHNVFFLCISIICGVGGMVLVINK